jgi:hypothetical protein
MKKQLICLAISLSLFGCATAPEKIATTYVSPLQYANYDCDQIISELTRVGERASLLNGKLKKQASSDSVNMTVGMILFFPSLFFIDGDSAETTEYGRIKGEYEALQKVAIQKKCGVVIEPIPEPIIDVKDEVKSPSSVVGGT